MELNAAPGSYSWYRRHDFVLACFLKGTKNIMKNISPQLRQRVTVKHWRQDKALTKTHTGGGVLAANAIVLFHCSSDNARMESLFSANVSNWVWGRKFLKIKKNNNSTKQRSFPGENDSIIRIVDIVTYWSESGGNSDEVCGVNLYPHFWQVGFCCYHFSILAS